MNGDFNGKTMRNQYEVISNRWEHTWELYCNEGYLGSFSSLDAVESERDLLEHEDELARQEASWQQQDRERNQ
jgi:hypothetical protein